MNELQLTYLSTGVLDTAFDSQVYQLLKSLHHLLSIRHFCFEPFLHWHDPTRQKKIEAIRRNIPLESFRSSPFIGRLSLLADAWRLRSDLLQGSDSSARQIIHSRGCLNGYCAAIALGRKRRDFFLVTDFRGVGGDEMARYSKNRIRQMTIDAYRSSELYKIEKLMYSESDQVICVSDAFRKWLIGQYDVEASQEVVVIPSLVNPSVFNFNAITRAHIRRELGLENRLVFIYSGGLAPWQKADETIRLFSKIHGKFPESFLLFMTRDTQHVETFLESFPLTGAYKVMSVDHTDVAKFLCAADIGFLLRDQTLTNMVASPIKFGEYISCGLPVLLTPGIGDTEKYLAELKVGEVIPDTDTLPFAIENLILNEEERSQLSQKGRKLFGIEENFKRLFTEVYRIDLSVSL
jgi:glycosyltransferase involved in cell wall biosynthesis